MSQNIIPATLNYTGVMTLERRYVGDYGQRIVFDEEMPTSYEVDFSKSRTNGSSVTMIGDETGVEVPDQCFATDGDVFVFLYIVEDNGGRTQKVYRIPVTSRSDRTDETPIPVQQSAVDQAISALNTAVAKTAQDVISADQSAQDASDDADRAEAARDAAEGYAQNASGSASAAATSASQASTSAQSASQSASSAATSAQTATTKATEASTSASSAASSASTAGSKASEASTSASTASTKASEAAQSATSANTAKTDAVAAKTAAETAQTAAETAQGLAEDAQEAAETAAQSIEASAAQIATNTADIADVKRDLNAIQTATTEDVDKALKVKTVTDGKVTDWEFGEAGSSVTVDSALDATSENPVQNKVITEVVSDMQISNGTYELTGWIDNSFIDLSGQTVDITTPTSSFLWRHMIVNCSEGDAFIINAKGNGTTVKPWAFIDASGNILNVATQYDPQATNRVLYAPANASKLIINDNKTGTVCYKGPNGILLAQVHQTDATNGHTYTLRHGIKYYSGGTTIGVSGETVNTSNDAYVKSIMITVPAGQILRICGKIGTRGDASTRVYRAYNQTTGKLCEIAPQTTDKVISYLKYNFDVHVYFNTLIAEDYYLQIIGKESPYYDIYSNVLEKHTTILDFNPDAPYAVKTMRRPERSQTRPFILCHFSDIHADSENLARMTTFFNDMTGLIDAKICTGDMVASTLNDGMDWWDAVNGTSDIMMTIGNHECATGTGSTVYNAASPQEVYAEVLADRISAWGVTQPTDAAANGLGYYYKDFATYKLRLIAIDLNHDASYKSTQLTWLTGVLADAKTKNYGVVIANHYQFVARSGAEKLDCTFNPGHAIKSETNDWWIPTDYEQAVDDFIDNGGEFVCWLTGHGHQDYVLINQSKKQLSIAVTTANFVNANAWSFGDDYREVGTKSQDAFNIVGIDTYSKNISVYRIGNDLSRLMQPRHRLCLDYANRKVIWSD